MPVDSNTPPEEGAPDAKSDSKGEPHPGAEDSVTPTLAALLNALTHDGGGEVTHGDPLSAALRAVRSRSSAAALDVDLLGVHNGMLRAMRQELGDQLSDMALRSMSGKPLTRRSVERILRAAADLSAAREAAFASVPAAAPPAGQPGNGHRANGSAATVAGVGASTVASGAVPRFEEILRPLLEGRHEVLLRQCLDLVRGGFQVPSDRHTFGAAAARLHDRVRAFLEKQGRWPIRDADEYERHVRPAAIVMAAWDTPITLDEP